LLRGYWQDTSVLATSGRVMLNVNCSLTAIVLHSIPPKALKYQI